MDTNDISTIWAADSPLDETNLVGESKRIPLLHSKYYNMYYREVLLRWFYGRRRFARERMEAISFKSNS